MVRLKRLFTIVLPVLLLTNVPASPQSTPTKVTVGGVDYNVTPMSRGRMLRVDDLDGHLIGMASVNGGSISVLAPQEEPGFSVVKGVANEYLRSANGAASATANTSQPPNAPGGDALAAQRAALAARMAALNIRTAGGPGASPSAPMVRTVTFPAEGGAVVHDPDLNADVTFTADGTEASYVRQYQGPMGSGAQEIKARFEGGDKPDSEGKKVGNALGTGARAVLQADNTHVTSRIGSSSEVWKVTEKTNGKESTLYVTGGYTVASAYSPRVQNPGQSLAEPMLRGIKADWEAIEKQVDTARQAGQTVQVDLSSDRSQRAKAALDKAVPQ
ncbi:MAG: hypothetical protein ABSD67_05285 [Terracidiphilus sp.]